MRQHAARDETGEVAGCEEGQADILDGTFAAAFFIAAGNRDGTRLEAVVPGEAQQAGMEADRIATPFQHRALEIVVEQDTRNAAPGGERRDVTTEKILHPGIEEEPEKNLPRVA